MTNRNALIIAIEDYSDASIEKVEYAERDAEGFIAAIRQHGYDAPKSLLSAKATKTTMESHIRRCIRRLTADDEFFLYYAGHGFSNKGHNFITCCDTDHSDLDETSISLQWIFKLIDESSCKRVALFLDCCESGITKLGKSRGLHGTMSEKEFDEFFRASEYSVCFSACKTSEYSYPSATLKHGIWTYHLIEALNGDAPKALVKGHRLTAASLQNYLSTAVPRTLRKVRSDLVTQTPWLYGGQNRDFQIADLKEILETRAKVKPGFQQIKRALLRETDFREIRSLSGFVKTNHHIPQYVSQATKDFVEKISQKETESLAEAVFEDIKRVMKYKRQDLEYEAGRIVTPHFEYGVWCAQDEDEPEMATVVEELTNIKPSIIDDERFNQVFDGRFSQIVFEFPRKLSMPEMIDALEDLEREDISIDYPKEASQCTVSFKGSDLELVIRGRGLTMKRRRASTPRGLLEAFQKAQMLLAATPITGMLNSQ